eukprot:13691903-Heterocapsa_arctica.AAC.1
MNSADLQNRQVTHELEMVIQSLHQEMSNRDMLNTAIAKNKKAEIESLTENKASLQYRLDCVRAVSPLNP